jgi:pyridoxamine 5'-phosphate oxidase
MSEHEASEVSRTIAHLRLPHADIGLEASDLDPDPMSQFGAWLHQALDAGLVLPNTMTLATATTEARPSARMVLLKSFDERGFTFYTNYESRKGRELAANPSAALVFYWAEFERQVRVAGDVTPVPRTESEEYFRTRPMGSRLGAWASRQSEVITSREAIEERVRALSIEYRDENVPLPPFWGGYRLSPDEIEFWQGRANRLHDRFRYRRCDERWVVERLSP